MPPSRILLGAALSVLLLSACVSTGAKGKAEDTPLSTGTAPIESELTAPGAQRRIVPWDSVVLESEVRYGLTPRENATVPSGYTPGLLAAESRLEARRRAIEDLANRLGRLPASEPPPGESVRPTVADLAARRPALAAAIRQLLTGGWTEEAQRPEGSDEVLIRLTLPIKELAGVVLDQGGGFSPTDTVAEELSARARAQNAAMEAARRQLLQKLLETRASGKLTVKEWAIFSPVQAQWLNQYVRSAKVLRSEARPIASGGEEWLVELEIDSQPLREQVAKDESDIRKLMEASAAARK